MEPLPINLVNNEDQPQKIILAAVSPSQQTILPHQSYHLNPPSSTHSPEKSLTPAQLYTFRSQILAYKHLVRNISVPQFSNQSIEEPNLWKMFNQKHTSKAGKVTIKVVAAFKDKTQKESELKAMIISNYKGVPKQEASETSDQFKYLIEKRKAEIDHLLEKGDDISIETKNRLMVEAKFLAVRDTYKQIYNRVSEGVRKEHRSLNLFQTQLLDRSFFKREKLSQIGETGNRHEKVENQMKSDHDRRKKLKHKEFMQHIKTHKDQFLEWHRKKLKDIKKVITQAKAILQTKKKEKDQIQEKNKVARLKILKTQNMEAYIKEVKDDKIIKIKELFNQTNRFLKELGAKVLLQKGKNQEEHEEMMSQNGMTQEKVDLQDIYKVSNRVYYDLTHTIKQEITKQPSILTGGQLKNYQVHGLQWLVSLYNNNLNGILADEMGLGKTIQTISLLCYLIEYKKNTGPFLIIAPLSTISNWMAQFEKWSPSIRKIVYKGNPAKRTEIQKVMKNTKWNVCITTYDFILKDRLKLNKYDWKYIVIDEGHKMKNAKSKFSTILGHQYQSDHRLLLTGTPLQNNLGELWALLNFLLPKVFTSCQDFEKWFSMAIHKNSTEKSVGDESGLDEEEQLLIINRLHQVLRPFLLRRVKKEVYSELPDKKEHVFKVQLSAWQKLIYQNISRKTALQFANNSGKISKTTLTNLMMQLRKCCNHPYLFLKNFDDIGYHEWIIRSSGKFELIDRILPKLKAFGHRLLIFTQMTHLMDIMQIYFEYKGIRHLRLDGSTKAEDRQERMKLFNQPNSQFDVFLLSTRAGGLGLNLQTADTVIIFDSDWNPQMDLQAQDRVHRIGQEKQVIVLRLITNNSIEEHILQRTAFKMNLNQLFIQGGLYNLNSSEAERRQKIEDILLKRRINNEDNDEEEILDDDMINQYLRRSDEEYEKFTEMDEQRYAREKYLYGFEEKSKKDNYRLMKYQEIPSWFIEAPKTTQANKELGKGHRLRKQINYSDEMTDDQFLNAFEEDDVEESAIEVPKAKRESNNFHRIEKIDIEDLLSQNKVKAEEAFFEEEDN